MFSTFSSCAESSGFLGSSWILPVAAVCGPLGEDCVEPADFSPFRLSNVSDGFFTSYLAEVELPFFPCFGGGDSGSTGLLLSVSSSEPDNVLSIEPTAQLQIRL